MKIQQNQANPLSKQEKRAVKDLIKGSSGELPNDEQETELSMKDMLRKRRKTDDNEKYICSDFIFESAAEVERVWITANYILSDVQSKLKPLIFEAILFLKYNESFGTINLWLKLFAVLLRNALIIVSTSCRSNLSLNPTVTCS